MRFNTLLFRVLLGLGLSVQCRAARPANTQESKTTSTLHRIVSGAGMAIKLVKDLVVPSQTPSTPTKIQVQFVGLGRTGTTSLASAMNILGYKVLHDDEGGEVMDLFGDYYEGLITENEMYVKMGERGFNCSFLYNAYEWAGRHEEVKVILNHRDPEKWVDSWLLVADLVDVLAKPPFIWIPSIRRSMPLYVETFKEIPTGGHPDKYLDRETLVKGYGIHVENVRKAVPKERLLEYKVTEGWEPLCEFLGVDVPDVPFPHINDRVKIRAVAAVLRIIPVIWPFLAILPLCLLWLMLRCFVKRTAGPTKKAKKA